MTGAVGASCMGVKQASGGYSYQLHLNLNLLVVDLGATSTAFTGGEVVLVPFSLSTTRTVT